MKKFIVLLGIVLILGLIGYFVMAPDDGGDFSVPAQRNTGQCAGCQGQWSGKGSIVDMIWE
ncbi:MAG: hypothetical protein VX399_01040 [SAR324 cluster bacterium]|nr:hypothetical protein [SAR324 cluster bacterium]